MIKRIGKKLILFIPVSIIFLAGGSFALNGWFGGGGTIPSDTMTRGLVGYWAFEEGSGSRAYDASDNGNHGTLNTYMSTSADAWTKGKVGGAIQFDGVDDYVDLNDANIGTTISGNNSFSVEAWIYQTSAGNWPTLFSVGTDYRFIIFTGTTAVDDFIFAGGYYDVSPRPSYIDNVWQHYVFTYDGAAVSVYLDGTLAGTAAPSGSINSTQLPRLGTFRAGASGDYQWWQGKIDEIKVYNRALSAEEVRYHYNRGAPVAHWKFDEGEGRTAYDSTDNNNDGTLVLAGSATSSAWTAGRHGSALSFDGVDDYVSRAYNTDFDFGTGSFSVSTWFKTPGLKILDRQVGAGTDDGRRYTGTGGFNNTNSEIIVGNHTNAAYLEMHNYFRFTGVTMSGTINEMHLSLWKRQTLGSGAPLLKVYGVDEDNPVAPTTADEFDADPLTSAAVDMDGAWAAGWNNTASLVSIGQELVDSYTINNEAVMFQLKNDGTTGINGMYPGNYEWDSTKAPKLHIEYTALPGYLISRYNDAGWKTWLDSSGNVCFGADDDVTWSPDDQICSSGTNYDDNKWHNVQVVKDGASAIYLYIDGKLAAKDASLTATGSLSGTSPVLYAGIDSDGSSSPWQGVIDDVKIYNYARSPDEIRLDYNAGFGARFGPLSGCDQDPGSCMTQGLVGYWDFEEGSGNMAYDQSDYTNHGTTSGDPQWTKGKVGGALSFDGTNDYVDTGDVDAMDGATALTVSAWVKVDDLTDDGVIIAKDIFDVGTQLLFWRDEVGAVSGRTDIFSIIVSDGTNDARVESASNASSDNNWRYVTITFTAGSVNGLRFYIDGKEDPNSPVSTASISALKSTINSLQIGKPITTANKEFTGLIDEVRIYNRALGAEEIRYHYNRGAPVAHWKFDEGEGRTAYDSTDNNNDGTLVLAGSATSSAWTAGRHGSALSFDGVDDYVDAGNVSANARTISFWLKRGDTSDRDVIDLGTPEIIISGNAVSSSGLTSPAYYVDGVKTAAIADTNWHHIVITDTADINANNIDIGKTDSSYFLGLIDDVRIYNYARTPDEIRLDYNAGFGARFGPLSGCDQDPGSCMTQGLVGYWDFEEGEGQSVYDSSDNNNNGTRGANGSVGSDDPSWAKGKTGSGLSFDGSDDYVKIPNSVSYSALDYTIEGWFKTSASPGVSMDIFAARSSGANHLNLIELDINSSYKLRFLHRSPPAGSGGTDIYSSMTLNDGNWHHFAAVATEDGFQNLYVDGVLDAQGVLSGTYSGALLIDLGVLGSSNSRNFNGPLDEIKVYNRALSAEEVRYHYNRGAPVAHWKFDEGEGRTAYDSTDNNNDGTLVLAGSATSSAWTAGRHGSALSFDGVDDYVDAGDTNQNIKTVSFWLKPKAGNKKILDLDNGVHYIEIDSNNDIQAQGFSSPAIYINGIDGNRISINQWQYITVITNTAIDANNVDIGRQGANYFDGLIDDVRFYNYARSAEQILQDYNAGFGSRFR